jgi:hypothetical protein
MTMTRCLQTRPVIPAKFTMNFMISGIHRACCGTAWPES